MHGDLVVFQQLSSYPSHRIVKSKGEYVCFKAACEVQCTASDEALLQCSYCTTKANLSAQTSYERNSMIQYIHITSYHLLKSLRNLPLPQPRAALAEFALSALRELSAALQDSSKFEQQLGESWLRRSFYMTVKEPATLSAADIFCQHSKYVSRSG